MNSRPVMIPAPVYHNGMPMQATAEDVAEIERRESEYRKELEETKRKRDALTTFILRDFPELYNIEAVVELDYNGEKYVDIKISDHEDTFSMVAIVDEQYEVKRFLYKNKVLNEHVFGIDEEVRKYLRKQRLRNETLTRKFYDKEEESYHKRKLVEKIFEVEIWPEENKA